MSHLHICISENRTTDEVGIKLLILSLTEHEPGAIIHIFANGLSERFGIWLRDFPNVVQESAAIDPGLTWNVKARLLTKLLDDSLGAVVWIDSDVIVTAPISRHFDGLADDVLVVAEEFFTYRNRGVAVRTKGWGLPVGRDLPFTPNSAVLRVTDRHRALLSAWQGLLDRPDYKALQAGPWSDRPFFMMGDQDALSAILGSADFASIPVRAIRRGRDIAQCFRADGYSSTERLANLRRMPPFVHAQGEKPWRAIDNRTTYQHVSPYWYAARPYESQLDPDERRWLMQRPMAAKILHILALGHPSLAGLLPAVQGVTAKRVSAAVRRAKTKMSR